MIYETSNAAERVDVKLIRFGRINKILKNILNTNIIQYVCILAIVSCVSIFGTYPLAIAMLGVATLYNIQLIIPVAVTSLMFMIIQIPTGAFVIYGGIALLYVLLITMFAKNKSNKKMYIMVIMAICETVSFLIYMAFTGYTIANIINTIITLTITLATIPVMTNGIVIPFNMRKKMIYSNTEIISFAILVAMCLTLLSNISIYNFNLASVIMLVTIVIVGWQNDWMVGGIVGVLVALVYSVISNASPLTLITFTFSGLISGVMNRFGKWSLVAFFAVGNTVLAYLYKADINFGVQVSQIFVASAVIIALPQKFLLKIEELFSNAVLLNNGWENQLGPVEEIKTKMGAVSEVFNNLANISIMVNEKTKIETATVLQKYLQDYLFNECEICNYTKECEKNIVQAAEYIALRLENGEYISANMLPFTCSKSEIVINEILDIYNNIKLMRVIKQKEQENNQKIIEQYNTISEVLKSVEVSHGTNMQKNIDSIHKRIKEELTYNGYAVYEDYFNRVNSVITYEFITNILSDIDKAKLEIQKIVSVGAKVPMTIKLILNSSKTEKSRIKLITKSKYMVTYEIMQRAKLENDIIGDSYLVLENEINDKFFVLSDGTGSGVNAHIASKKILSVVDGIVKTNIKEKQMVSIVTKVLSNMSSDSYKATLDLLAIDENNNTLNFAKLDATPTYIIHNGEVRQININSINGEIISEDIISDTYVIISTDGAIPYLSQKFLEDVIKSKLITGPKMLLEEISKDVDGIMLDDVTLLVVYIK